MEFAFPKLEKITVYPRTFLRDVCVSLCFRPVLDSENAIKNFISLREKYFRISPTEPAELRPRKEDDPLIIASADNQVIFRFYLDTVSLKLKVPAYKQFANLMAFMPAVVDFLKAQGIETIDNVRITKFNETNYSLPSDSTSVEMAMQGIFSPAMMEWDGFKNPDFSDVSRWERRIDFSDSHDDASAMVLYGFIKDDLNREKGSLTLKTSVEKRGLIPLNYLEDELRQCNLSVDSAFHWAASDDILNEMQKK